LLSPLIGALVLTILAGLFAAQNAVPITVKFLFWKFEGSLALVLILSFALGVVVTLLALIPRAVFRRRG